MITYNTNNTKEKLLFENMYRDYINELGLYSERVRKHPATDKDIQDINTNPFLKRYFITNENGVPVGFCLLGFGENTHPGTDYYIQEFYILPSHRLRKYGEEAVTELLQTHPGKYCYFILKGNIPAENLWNKTTQNLDCIDITSEYDASPYTPSDCNYYAFETAN